MPPLPLACRVARCDFEVISLQRPYFFHHRCRRPPRTSSSGRCSASASVSRLAFENRRRRYQGCNSWRRIRVTPYEVIAYEMHLWKPITPDTLLSRDSSLSFHLYARWRRSHRAIDNRIYFSPEWNHLGLQLRSTATDWKGVIYIHSQSRKSLLWLLKNLEVNILSNILRA